MCVKKHGHVFEKKKILDFLSNVLEKKANIQQFYFYLFIYFFIIIIIFIILEKESTPKKGKKKHTHTYTKLGCSKEINN